jgi:hypothetical protein
VVCAVFLTSSSLAVDPFCCSGPLFGATVAAAGGVIEASPDIFVMIRNRSADAPAGNCFNPPSATMAYQSPAAADALKFDHNTFAGSQYFAAAEVKVFAC